MPDLPRLLTLAAVAERLGVTLRWLRDHRRELEAAHGFPAPLPGIGTYDPTAIAAWLARTRGEPSPAPAAAAPGSEDEDDSTVTARLRGRALALAGRAGAS